MSKPSTEDSNPTAPDPAEPRADMKVPEWAENMEHTLRRLAAEKQKQRAKHPELYR